MATLPSDTTPKTDLAGPDAPGQVDNKKKNKLFKTFIEACKGYRRKLVANWTVSIDYRRGKPFASQTDEDRISVNLDWALTKAKHAALWSQIPTVRTNHPPQTLDASVSGWVKAFEQKLNDTLIVAGVESAMDEAMPDCINAAGIGLILVSHEAITENVQVPGIDLGTLPPEILQMIVQTGAMPDGSPIPMETVPRVVDHRYVVSRLSPADFLWPLSFTGSDFDNSPWIGRSGRISWAEGSKKWNLKDSDKNAILGEDRTTMDRLTHDIDKDKLQGEELIGFDELWYKEFHFDPACKSFSTIHHLVFITGKDEPVVDEPWKGQQEGQNGGQLTGAMRYPLQVISLAYITDEAIPPSDSAIGRPQVNELNKSRTQMILQRERSMPVRWFDVNRIDPTVQQSLMRGVWQGMIPVQGSGTNVIGEVSRSQMPQENFLFDKVAKADLSELWQVGQGESGANVETKGEANVIQSNFQTRIARERAKVGRAYCRIAEVLGGLLCLYEEPTMFGQGFDPAFSRTLAYSILADSTVLLDSNQRLQRALDFYNFCMKTGWLDEEPVLKEIATLSGFDPNVIRPPQPKTPQEPNISLRLTGQEDMMNPLMLAFLMKSGQAPSTDLIEQAKQLIIAATLLPPNAIAAPPPVPEIGPDGMPVEAAPQPGGQIPPGIPTAPPMPVGETPAGPPDIGKAHPDLSAMDRVNKRVVDR